MKREWTTLHANIECLKSMFQEDFSILKSEVLNNLNESEYSQLMDNLNLTLVGDKRIKSFISNYKNNENISIEINDKGKYLFKFIPTGIKLPFSVKFNPFNGKALLKIEFNILVEGI